MDQLHADLVLVDAIVADDVIPIHSGEDHVEGAIDIPERLEEIRDRIRSLAGHVGPEDRARLLRYSVYCDLLNDVYMRAVVASEGQP